MDGCFSYQELKALQELINPTKDSSDSEDDLPQAGARKLGKLKLALDSFFLTYLIYIYIYIFCKRHNAFIFIIIILDNNMRFEYR